MMNRSHNCSFFVSGCVVTTCRVQLVIYRRPSMLAAFRSHDWNSCPLFPSINVNITFTDVVSVSAIGPQGQIITGIRPKKTQCESIYVCVCVCLSCWKIHSGNIQSVKGFNPVKQKPLCHLLKSDDPAVR